MKNIDAIRKKTLHQLADFILNLGGCCHCCVHFGELPEVCDRCYNCREGIEQWLYSEETKAKVIIFPVKEKADDVPF